MAANSEEDLGLLEAIGAQAGKIALKYFRSDNKVWMKPDDSPVSQADIAVNDYLQRELLAARPDYGWLSEETEDNDERQNLKRVFVVDPVDGTRGFIKGLDEWCISVAVVEAGRPIAAILECPALAETYRASTNTKTHLNGKMVCCSKSSQIRQVTGSRKINELITSSFDGRIGVAPFVPSLAYRIALVAAGKIDLALARPGAHDWDLAAADLIIANAGGKLAGPDGEKLIYNRKNLRHEALIACPIKLQNSALQLAKSAGILH